MRHVGFTCTLLLASLLTSTAAAGAQAAAPPAPAPAPRAPATLTVQIDQPGIKVSPLLYGLFFEEINRGGDGGLYAELVQNRSFEDADKPGQAPTQPLAWTLVTATGCAGAIALDTARPLNDQNPHGLKLEATKVARDGRVGVANEGFKGIALRQDARYLLSLCARAAGGFTGPLVVTLETPTGMLLAANRLDNLSGDWQKLACTFTAAATCADARLVIALHSPGTVYLDMVSLFPQDTWKHRPNGLRPDLAQMLADLKPGFVRFPGGCWVEGETLATAYRWKTTIGDLAQRRNVYNLWRYYSPNGLGYHEYLQMCEDLGAQPLFVINVGMSHKENVPLDQMGEWVQDALDAIEYANGPATSQWGARRAAAGHPAPFNLKYMEIGNENGGAAYRERYPLFVNAIKARYPQMHLVADEWGGRPQGVPLEMVDEHYYSNPTFFMHQANRYDGYDRQGPKVYVGEYAVTQGGGAGNLMGALGEAAFMTGMERNGDVVAMASYAPLFAHVGYKAWNPDLINFDGTRCYGTPSYYVQKLFGQNRAEVVLPLALVVPPAPPEAPPVRRGAVGVGTWATQAEYKDVTVTQGEKVVFRSDFSEGLKGWKTHNGQWSVEGGTLRQTAGGNDCRATVGDPAWTDYTLRLKARKLGGAEGFLVMFHVRGEGDWAWWNVGGWGNQRHALEVSAGGSKATLGDNVPGKIETGRWYDLRVEVQGQKVRCHLDGKLVHDVTYAAPPAAPLYAVAGQAGGDVIVKVVNALAAPQPATINLRGGKTVAATATATVLTGRPEDENTLDQPRKVAPVMETIDAGRSFRYTFAGYSVTVLRVKAQP